MNRRGFLGTLVGGVIASAAVRTWPFRVFSFPTEIVVANTFYDGPVFALQVETVRKEIPTIYESECTFMGLLHKRPMTVSSWAYRIPLM